MLLTKKKLHKIRNTKLQSRKRYKKKGGKRKRRKRRNKKSFRKSRPLNLRKKTLKYKKKRKQKGGAKNYWAMPIKPTVKDNTLMIDHFVLYEIANQEDYDIVVQLFNSQTDITSDNYLGPTDILISGAKIKPVSVWNVSPKISGNDFNEKNVNKFFATLTSSSRSGNKYTRLCTGKKCKYFHYLLSEQYNANIHPIKDDGDCLFRALATVGGQVPEHKELRAKIVQHIMDSPNKDSDFDVDLQDKYGGSWEVWERYMKLDKGPGLMSTDPPYIEHGRFGGAA